MNHYLLKTNLTSCAAAHFRQDSTKKLTQLHLNYEVAFFVSFVILWPPLRRLHAHFFGIFVQQSVTASHPANEPGSQLSCPPACQRSPLRPTDSGGMGRPLEANGSCPPPRAENGLECCLPQTHQATAQKKDHNTEAAVWDSGNFLEGWDMLRENNLIDAFRLFLWFAPFFTDRRKPSVTARE